MGGEGRTLLRSVLAQTPSGHEKSGHPLKKEGRQEATHWRSVDVRGGELPMLRIPLQHLDLQQRVHVWILVRRKSAAQNGRPPADSSAGLLLPANILDTRT